MPVLDVDRSKLLDGRTAEVGADELLNAFACCWRRSRGPAWRLVGDVALEELVDREPRVRHHLFGLDLDDDPR